MKYLIVRVLKSRSPIEVERAKKYEEFRSFEVRLHNNRQFNVIIGREKGLAMFYSILILNENGFEIVMKHLYLDII